MRKRRVFYSFNYAADSWRAAAVRNIGLVEGSRPATDNEWEEVTKGGETAIKKWIGEQMRYRSCTLVLVGERTARRHWIDYEIKKTWELGMGLASIHIHNLLDQDRKVSHMGHNPFQHFKVNNRAGHTLTLSSIVKCYDPPGYDSRGRYSWIRENMAEIVEEAIQVRDTYP